MLTPDAAAFIQSNAPFALDLLRVLARIPAPSCQEEKRVRFCQTLLESWGARSAFVDQAGNLVYPVGDQGDNPLVVFAAHADIVFPDTQSLPLREDDTRLFCPGVGDNTANLVALLLYLKYVLSRGLQPAGPGILFVVNTGEEGLGNLKGVRYLDGIYGSRMAEFYSFDGQMTGITDRAVGSRRYRVTVRTRGGHSLSGFGRPSAIAELAAMIGNIYALPVPAESIATYNVGTIEGGLSVNAIAPETSMVCEYRADHRDMLQRLDKAFLAIFQARRRPGVQVLVEEAGYRPCEHLGLQAEARRQDMVHRAAAALRRCRPDLEVCAGAGSTDCNVALARGIPAVCFGFYTGGGAHTREEYLWKDSLLPGYRACFETVLPYFRPRP